MTIPVTCPRCRTAARVPDALVGQTVRCPQCLTPFPAPANVPPPAAADDPPTVTAAANPGPPDVPVVKIRRPTTAPPPARGVAPPAVVRVPPRRKDNAGLFVGVAVGAAVFLILGGIGVAFVLFAVDYARAPARSRLGPPPPFPQPWGFDRGGPGDAPAGPEPIARSRPLPKPLADVRMPDSREVRAPRAGRPLPSVNGFVVTPVEFDEPAATADLCWSADADSLFTLSPGGLLRRLTYPVLEEQRRLDLGHDCDQVVLSGEGLLVTLPGLQEVWVIDPDALIVRRRVGVAGLRTVVTGPELAVAYCLVPHSQPGSDVDTMPVRIDLTTGAVSGTSLVELDPNDGITHAFGCPTLTLDGRFLFAESGPRQLTRYRVEGNRLAAEETCADAARGRWRCIHVSPDGRCVGVVTDATARVYVAADLNRPPVELPTPAAVAAFDPATRRIFASTRAHMLAVFDPAGGARGELAWPGQPAAAQQLLVHPRGLGVLLRTDAGLFRVDVPAP